MCLLTGLGLSRIWASVTTASAYTVTRTAVIYKIATTSDRVPLRWPRGGEILAVATATAKPSTWQHRGGVPQPT